MQCILRDASNAAFGFEQNKIILLPTIWDRLHIASTFMMPKNVAQVDSSVVFETGLKGEECAVVSAIRCASPNSITALTGTCEGMSQQVKVGYF